MPCATSTAPNTRASASSVMEPGLRITGFSPVKSSTVLSIPKLARPPSSTNKSSCSGKSAITWSVVVGEICPERLALGALMGPSTAYNNARATGCMGERTAMVCKLAVASSGTSMALFKIMVSGPGQNFAASLLQRKSHPDTSVRASTASSTCAINGLSDGRPLIS